MRPVRIGTARATRTVCAVLALWLQLGVPSAFGEEAPSAAATRSLFFGDLHVHSWHSGRADLPLLEHVGRECYSDPSAVYEEATRRGMDVVTLTDQTGGPFELRAEAAGKVTLGRYDTVHASPVRVEDLAEEDTGDDA